MNNLEDIPPPSDRSFGLVLAAVFAIIGLYPLINQSPVRLWSIAIGGAFTLAALLVPKVLRPANLLWFRIGLLMHRIVNPVVMGAIYFVVIVPAGLAWRAVKRDPLRLRPDDAIPTYWIKRTPPGPASDSLRHPF